LTGSAIQSFGPVWNCTTLLSTWWRSWIGEPLKETTMLCFFNVNAGYWFKTRTRFGQVYACIHALFLVFLILRITHLMPWKQSNNSNLCFAYVTEALARTEKSLLKYRRTKTKH